MTHAHLLKKAVLLSGVAILAFAATAQAGFEWKGPLTPPPAAVTAPPMDTNPDDGLMPVTSWSKDDAAGAPAAMAPVTSQTITTQTTSTQTMSADPMPARVAAEPVHAEVAMPASSMPASDMAAAPMPSETSGDVLNGFGSDVPLVIALQQVVPAGYQYSFSAGVNPGVSVSWQGGKSWQGVLADMLASQGLGYRLQGSAVVIGNFASPDQPQAAQVATPESDMAVGMSPMPSSDSGNAAANDSSNAPVNIASPAPEAAAPQRSTVVSEKPVTIHREKRSSLLERLGWTHDDRRDHDNIAVPSETASQPGGPGNAPAPEVTPSPAATAPADSSMSSDPMSEPAPVAKPLRSSSDSTWMPGGTNSASSDNAAPQQLASAATPPRDNWEAAKPRSNADAAMSSSAMEAGATPASAPAAMQAVAGDWKGTKGQTLRDVLKTWSDKAGVDLYWSIDYDYRLSDNVAYPGGYDQAVGSLLDQFATVRPQPYGQLHQSASGPRVLVVKSYDVTR